MRERDFLGPLLNKDLLAQNSCYSKPAQLGSIVTTGSRSYIVYSLCTNLYVLIISLDSQERQADTNPSTYIPR